MSNTIVKDYAGREIVFYQPFLRRKLFHPETDEDTVKYPKIRRNRERGERDIIDITATKDREVAWLYSEDSGEWYCTSYLQNGSGGGIHTLGFDFSQLGRKVTLYHTHPEGPNLYENLMQMERLKQQFEL